MHQHGEPPLPAGFTPAAAIAGLYLHVPFCFHKCHYCDFYSLAHDATGQDDLQVHFVRALVAELRHAAERIDLRPSTVFVGGGTPTLLAARHWRTLLRAMHDAGLFRDVREFTVEANPETVTDELMTTLADGGVNRVSLGAQSFNPAHLRMLERWHEPASVGRAVRCVRSAGIDNLNLDLIFAIPGQSLVDIDTDLDQALALEPTHLSYYGLTYEPNTAMRERLRQGQFQPADEMLERAMYERILDRMADEGFEHYEISAWARQGASMACERASTIHPPVASRQRPSFRCRHNLLYWTNANWLGFGPSAASHVDGRRWKNLPRLHEYIQRSPQPPTGDHEQLDPSHRIGERLMLGLRLRDGVGLTWLNAALPPDDPRRATVDELVALHLLERTAGALRLTRRGLLVADAVIARLL